MVTAAAGRRSRLREAWPADVDALLLTSLVSVRWASGFTGTTAALLVPRDPQRPTVIATDGRYRLRAAAESPDLQLLVTRRRAADLVVAMVGGQRVGIEGRSVTLSAYDELTRVAAGAGVHLVTCTDVVEQLRAHKDVDELAGLRAACAATDAAFHRVLGQLRPGLTERSVAWDLTVALRETGADADAFDAIVAGGPNAAIPHHRPGDRPLERGDLLTVDFGGVVDGQHADMTRTVVLGPPHDWQRDLHAAVGEIQAEIREQVRPGAVPRELDEAAAARIRTAGYAVAHGLGHGVGLEIHEEPWLVPGSRSAPLQPDTALTVEPGIYLDGRGGVRIEDTVVVTAAGSAPLTGSERGLVEV